MSKYIACCNSPCVRCEVQFDYGLRQGRHKNLAARPDSFVSKSGKEIKVEKKIAASNEIVLQKGKVDRSVAYVFIGTVDKIG